MFVDLVPHTAFFDKAYFLAFHNYEQHGLDEYLKQNEKLVNDLKSVKASHLDCDTMNPEPSTSGQDGKRTDFFDDFKLVAGKPECLTSLQGMTLNNISLSPEPSFSKKGGLGKIYLSQYQGFPVDILVSCQDQTERDTSHRFQSFCPQTA